MFTVLLKQKKVKKNYIGWESLFIQAKTGNNLGENNDFIKKPLKKGATICEKWLEKGAIIYKKWLEKGAAVIDF